jgi:hypothetical protein
MRAYSLSMVAVLVASLGSVLPLGRSHAVTWNLSYSFAKCYGLSLVLPKAHTCRLVRFKKDTPCELTHFPLLYFHLLNWYLSFGKCIEDAVMLPGVFTKPLWYLLLTLCLFVYLYLYLTFKSRTGFDLFSSGETCVFCSFFRIGSCRLYLARVIFNSLELRIV